MIAGRLELLLFIVVHCKATNSTRVPHEVLAEAEAKASMKGVK